MMLTRATIQPISELDVLPSTLDVLRDGCTNRRGDIPTRDAQAEAAALGLTREE
jgi:hypothetical protein